MVGEPVNSIKYEHAIRSKTGGKHTVKDGGRDARIRNDGGGRRARGGGGVSIL
jgi:hypothetical protein